MTNAELWQSYKELTQTLSENARKLAFAAVGLGWVFKTDVATFPTAIRIALCFVVAFFICDIMQFVIGAVLLRIWTRREEKKKWKNNNSLGGDYEKPDWLDTPSFIMWWVKIIALLLAYACLGMHLIKMN